MVLCGKCVDIKPYSTRPKHRKIDIGIFRQRTAVIVNLFTLPFIELSLLGQCLGDHDLLQSSCVLRAHPMRAVVLSRPHSKCVSRYTVKLDLHTCDYTRRPER